MRRSPCSLKYTDPPAILKKRTPPTARPDEAERATRGGERNHGEIGGHRPDIHFQGRVRSPASPYRPLTRIHPSLEDFLQGPP